MITRRRGWSIHSASRASRVFRPSFDSAGTCLNLENRYSTSWAFVGTGVEGEVTAQALSTVTPNNNLAFPLPGEFQEVTAGPVPAGCSPGSSLSNVVIDQVLVQLSVEEAELLPLATLSLAGSVTATVSANPPGGYMSSIDVIDSHMHHDAVQVYDLGFGPQFREPVGSDFPTMINMQRTAVQSTEYTWQTKDIQTGAFNPNWTVTVGFAMDLSGISDDFRRDATLTIKTPHVTILLATGDFAQGGMMDQSIYVNGALIVPADGLTVIDNNANVLYHDGSVNSGAASSYTGQWTFPASAIETLRYKSELDSGPNGLFGIGTTTADPSFSYSFKMQLNS